MRTRVLLTSMAGGGVRSLMLLGAFSWHHACVMRAVPLVSITLLRRLTNQQTTRYVVAIADSAYNRVTVVMM